MTSTRPPQAREYYSLLKTVKALIFSSSILVLCLLLAPHVSGAPIESLIVTATFMSLLASMASAFFAITNLINCITLKALSSDVTNESEN